MNLRRIGLSLFIFIALAGVVQAASFIKIDGIDGEVKDTDKEIEVLEVREFSITPTDTGGTEAEDDWEEPRGTTEPQSDGSTEHQADYILCPDGTMIQPGEKCPEEEAASVSGYMKIGDIKGEATESAGGNAETTWKVEEGEKAAYILCPDGTMIQPGEKCPEEATAGGNAETTWKVEEGEKAAYILCPDGTMIQPGEKCPEEDAAAAAGGFSNIENLTGGTEPSSDGGNAETTWKVEKGEKAADESGDHQDLTVTKEIDKATPKLQEAACDGVDNDCDGAEAQRRRGDVKLEDISVTKEVDKSTPKLAESVTRGAEDEDDIEALDVDSDNDGIQVDDVDGDGDLEVESNSELTIVRSTKGDDPEVKLAYILCPDGTMIQPGEKCPEEDREVLSHELAHVVQQSSGKINVENDTPVVVEEDEEGERTVEVAGVESRSVLGLFAVEVPVTVKLDESGNFVQVKRPWYSFFSW